MAGTWKEVAPWTPDPLNGPVLTGAYPFETAKNPKVLDVRQLAAILCIADAIEFSDSRVLDGVLALAKADDSKPGQVSYRENRKHDCIRDSLALDAEGQVIVSGTFDEPEVVALAHHTFDQMEDWVRGYCDIDRDSTVPRLRIRPEPFRRRLDILGARFERLGVRMSKRSVIDLIASNSVWRNDLGIAVRELVQNAVEACRYRRFHSSGAEAYEPKVHVVFDRTQRIITVQDNGCGMSERTVLDHFLTVGSSRAKAPTYLQGGYHPIARFGIGFWSVFTIADRARIETRPFEGAASTPAGSGRDTGFAFDVELDSLKDYTVFEAKHLPVGTTVTLFLRSELVLDEIAERAQGHLLSSLIPITWVLDGNPINIPENLQEVSASQLLGVRRQALESTGVRVFSWRKVLGEIDLALAFAYRVEGDRPTFQADQAQSILNSIGGIHFPRTGVCGFSVAAQRVQTCFAIERVGQVVANHRSPKGFVFSLDRQSLIENDAQLEFAQGMTASIHDAYRKFLNDNNAFNPKCIFHLKEESELNGGNVYDQYTGRELLQANDNWADLFCVRLFPVEAGRKFTDVEPIYVDLHQIQTMEGNGWVLQSHIVLRPLVGQPMVYNPERSLELAYKVAQTLAPNLAPTKPSYLLDPNRYASMFFDADPNSTAHWLPINMSGCMHGTYCCIQQFSIENILLDPMRHDILAEVKGRWSGAVYSRDFNRHDSKPYVFLGRYRLLVRRGSKLHDRLASLKAEGRILAMISIIVDLQDDDAGFTSDALKTLL